ncbi:hypothetical protein ScPMuIL_005868 [Solemya velum]
MEPWIYKRYCKKEEFRARSNTSESYKLHEFRIEHSNHTEDTIQADDFHDVMLAETENSHTCNACVLLNEKALEEKTDSETTDHNSERSAEDSRKYCEKHFLKNSLKKDISEDRHHCTKNVDNGRRKSVRSTEMKPPKTFKQEMLSPLFMWDLMWMCFQRLRSWFFIGAFNPWITHMAGGDKALVSHYTSVFSSMQFFGIFTAPLSGFLMDRKMRAAEIYNNRKYERLHASIASFALNSGVSVLLSIGAALPILRVQYVTFFLHTLNRSFIYGPNSAFVANAFPSEHFGKLLGVTLTVSAIFGMLQFPLFLWIQGPLNNNPFVVNIIFIVLMLLSFIHPVYIWRYLKRKRKKYYKPESEASPKLLST